MSDSARKVYLGGYFEDETGWWMLDDVDEEGTAWLIGPDGQERSMTVASLPELTYMDS